MFVELAEAHFESAELPGAMERCNKGCGLENIIRKQCAESISQVIVVVRLQCKKILARNMSFLQLVYEKLRARFCVTSAIYMRKKKEKIM